jgi:antitoxin YefM
MDDVSYTEFRQQNARAVVVLSEAEYDSMVETLHLLKNPANAERLLRSIKNANAGKLTERDAIS